MKKLVAALLVLTMVLALTGSAMAGCKFSIHQYVKFNKNAYAYTEPKNSKKTNDPATIVSKGSIGYVEEVSGNWVLVRLTPYETGGNYVCPANGSCWAVEGITSPDGRVFGKMGHAERIGSNLYKNVPGRYDLRMFEAAVRYFR